MAPVAVAEDTFVLVFLEDAPVRHIKVAVYGKIVGVTDGDGLVQASLDPSAHKLYLITEDNSIPVKFSLPVDGQVEISAVYNRDETIDPIIKTQVFKNGSDATGYIAGRVTSPSGVAIEGAVVEVKGLGLSSQTNDKGIYSLELPRGSHDLAVSRTGYQPSSSTSVRVFADLGVNALFKLLKQPASGFQIALPASSMEEVATLGVFNPSDGAENLERYATSIVNAVDADQIARFGDSDVAAVLERIVDLSVVNDKYADVRGLDGRYISTKFNHILMPSTDPLRRDVQLDIFPANIVKTIEVQKSFTADQLASTTGGWISVITNRMPDECVGKFSISIGANTAFTGDDVQIIKNQTAGATPVGSNDPRGIELNSSDEDCTPEIAGVIANVTIIGGDVANSAGEYGMRLRGSVTAAIHNSAVTGYVDVTAKLDTPITMGNFLCDTIGVTFNKEMPVDGSSVVEETIVLDDNYAITNASAEVTAEAITTQDNGSTFQFDATDFVGAVKEGTTPWYAEWAIPGSL